MYGRLAALPDEAEPLQRAQLLAALSVGTEIIQLRHIAPQPRRGRGARRGARGLRARKQRDRDHTAAQLDDHLASAPDAGPETALALRARGSILVISEALTEHASYFDAGAPA